MNNLNVVSWMGITSPWGSSVAKSNITGVQNMFFDIMNSLYVIATILAVIMMVYGGIVYITSAGDEGKIKQGGAIITNALIGLVVMFLLKAIFAFIVSLF